MKFSIERDEIYEAVQKVVNVIPQRSTIPMTQNILFTAEGDQLELITTDLEITMVSNVKADIEVEGRIALPGRLVNDILRELPNVSLTLEADDKYRSELRSKFGQYKIGGENPDEFPNRPQLSEVQEVVLPNEVLKRLIDKTIFACSTDELRPALTGVYFQLGKNEIRAVATDGHRLGMLTYRDDALPQEEVNAIISTRALNFVLRSLDGEGLTAMILGNKHALFHMENTQLFARLIEEMYVDYNRVIPDETNFDLVVNSPDFLSSVKRVSLFSNPLSAKVVMQITSKMLTLQAEDMDYGGAAREEILCDFSEDNLTIGFNSRYLQNVLRHVDSEEVLLQFVRPDFAVLVKPTETPENEEQLMLLMPIRLE